MNKTDSGIIKQVFIPWLFLEYLSSSSLCTKNGYVAMNSLSARSFDSRRKIKSTVKSQYNVMLSCRKKEQKM